MPLLRRRRVSLLAALCPAGSANNTALDGSNTGQGTGPFAINLTTSLTNDIICVVPIYNGSASVSTVTDTAGLTFTHQASNSGGAGIDIWTALSPSALSGDTITITPVSGGGFVEAIVFGVHGCNTVSPIDSNGALPTQSNGAALSFTTSNANDFLISAFRDGTTAGPAAGWTQIQAAAGFTLVQYKIVTATQSALSVSDPAGSSNGGCGIALVSS